MALLNLLSRSIYGWMYFGIWRVMLLILFVEVRRVCGWNGIYKLLGIFESGDFLEGFATTSRGL